MRFDADRFHGAQILALGVFRAGAAKDVAIASLGENFLRLDLELRSIDDLQLLHFGAAGVLDLLIAGQNRPASRLARASRGDLRRLRQCRCRRCHGCRRQGSCQKKIAPLHVHECLPFDCAR